MIGPQHALLKGRRNEASEPELTRVLASLFAAEPQMASGFVQLVCAHASRGNRLDLHGLPDQFECHAEQALEEGRADLMIISAHARSGQDILVTEDVKGFVAADGGKREVLEQLFDTKIMRVDEFLAFLEARR